MGGKYIYYNADGELRRKTYSFTATCQYTSDNVLTLEWIVDESTLKSTSSDDGVGTLVITYTGNTTGAWYEPTGTESAQSYTTWGKAISTAEFFPFLMQLCER